MTSREGISNSKTAGWDKLKAEWASHEERFSRPPWSLHQFLPLGSCPFGVLALTSFSDGDTECGSVSQINTLLPQVSLVMVFPLSNRNPKEDKVLCKNYLNDLCPPFCIRICSKAYDTFILAELTLILLPCERRDALCMLRNDGVHRVLPWASFSPGPTPFISLLCYWHPRCLQANFKATVMQKGVEVLSYWKPFLINNSQKRCLLWSRSSWCNRSIEELSVLLKVMK